MDLASGFWQVNMAEEDNEKTAFATRKGLFQYTVMPFGLINVPSIFEHLMELVLQGMLWERCLVYIDYNLCYGTTFDQTLQNLEAVFSRIQDAGLELKASKCHLFQESASFLGYIVDRKGLKFDPEKVEAVTN